MHRLIISSAVWLCLPPTLIAQAPGTVIETDGTLMRNRALLKQAAGMRDAGELMTEAAQKSAVLDKSARVFFRQGNNDDAITTHKDAIERASEAQRPSLQKTQEAYEGGKLPDADE